MRFLASALSIVTIVCFVSAGVIINKQTETKQHNTDDDDVTHTEPWQNINVTMCNEGSPKVFWLSNQTSITVRSPNFGDGTYPDNARCQVVFKTEDDPMVVLLQFNTFEVELAMDFGSCDYDWLCVNGIKLCGDWATNQTFEYIIPPHKTFTLYFSSDVSVNRAGFEANIQVHTAVNRTVNMPSSRTGMGTKPDQMTYITTALSSEYVKKYRDRCSRTGYYSIVLPDSRSRPSTPSTRRRD